MIVMHVKFLQVEIGGYSCHAMQLCTCMLFLSASVLNVNKFFQVLVKVFQGDPRLWQAYSHTLQESEIFSSEYKDLLAELENDLTAAAT